MIFFFSLTQSFAPTWQCLCFSGIYPNLSYICSGLMFPPTHGRKLGCVCKTTEHVASLLPKKFPSFWNATFSLFVVHKSSYPLFLWESNFQFNFLSCDTGLMVFTNPPGLLGSAVLPPSLVLESFPLILQTFLPFLGSAVPPLPRADLRLVWCLQEMCWARLWSWKRMKFPLFSSPRLSH